MLPKKLHLIIIFLLSLTMISGHAYGINDTENDEVFESYFFKQHKLLSFRLQKVLHPIIHGHGEKNNQGLLAQTMETAKDSFEKLMNGEFSAAYKSATSDSSFWRMAKTVVGGAVNKYVGENAEKVLFHGGFYQDGVGEMIHASGQDSLNLMLAEQEELEHLFPDWNEKEECGDHGMITCKNIGPESKKILKSMQHFFKNIMDYERQYQRDFFTVADCDRIFSFLDRLTVKISEINLLHALSNQGKGGCPDDSMLRPYVKVINFLVAIPTKFHQIQVLRRKNDKEIAQLISFLPTNQQRKLYFYMDQLEYRPLDKDYGHNDGDSGVNLLFSGKSGTGKTFVGKRLPELLGYYPLVMTLEELARGQQSSYNDLEDLVDSGELSGFETKVLKLSKNSGTAGSVSSLNMVIFIDELDEDRDYNISELKDQFDQFKRIYFPSLGISIPGFINCIFTTNNEHLFTDAAMISRLTMIHFPQMNEEKKTGILLRYLFKKLESPQFEKLRELYTDEEIKELALKMVRFNKKINIRILIDNIGGILYFLETSRRIDLGEDHLIAPCDRHNHQRESFDDFLERTLGNIDLRYENESDDEDDSGDETISESSDDQEDLVSNEISNLENIQKILDSSDLQNLQVDQLSNEFLNMLDGEIYKIEKERNGENEMMRSDPYWGKNNRYRDHKILKKALIRVFDGLDEFKRDEILLILKLKVEKSL